MGPALLWPGKALRKTGKALRKKGRCPLPANTSIGDDGTDTETIVMTEAELTALLHAAFLRLGANKAVAPIMAGVITSAERDGAHSHGLLRLAGYAGSLRAGWVDGRAVPEVTASGPSILAVDGKNGFAQVALAAARKTAIEMAAATGLCMVMVRRTHHFGALWPDVEMFARAGLVALSTVSSRPYMMAWDSREKLFGTNPLAFACPRPDGLPVVWDQASTTRAQGEILLARGLGQTVPLGTGVDAAGRPTTDPNAILEGGALLPFGGPKGANIAFMAEVLVGVLGGGSFGFEDDVARFPGAQTSVTGQFFLLIDPKRPGRSDFAARTDMLLDAVASAGVSRLPADRRYAERERSRREGIRVPAESIEQLHAIVGDAPA